MATRQFIPDPRGGVRPNVLPNVNFGVYNDYFQTKLRLAQMGPASEFGRVERDVRSQAAPAAVKAKLEEARKRGEIRKRSAAALSSHRKALEDQAKAAALAAGSTADATATMVRWTKIMFGVKIATAAVIGLGETRLRGRLQNRGDYADLAARRLQPSTGVRVASAIPGLGGLQQLEQQRNEQIGLVDAANAAKLLSDAFLNLRANVDANARQISSQGLGIKYRYNPEEAAHQQRLLNIKLGPEADAEDIMQNLRRALKDATLTGMDAERAGVGTPGPKSARVQVIRDKYEAAANRLNLIRAEGIPQRDKLLGQAAKLRDLSKQQFQLDQLAGTKPQNVASFAAVGVAGELPTAGEQDPIVTNTERANTLLRQIKDILDGRLPKGKGA